MSAKTPYRLEPEETRVRACMKVMVKCLLRQYGYPLDMQAPAIELLLEQAKVFTEFEVENSYS